ncbi:MAG: hypothetical protein ACRYFS_10720 [Janthinobacterium lividum]
MKKSLILGSLALSLVPMFAVAAPAKTVHHAAVKKTAATMYECQKCHMQVSAATAKKDGYKDPMDGGKLLPVKMAK